MAIVGIDQSLTGTGLALLDNEGKLVKTTIIKTGKYSGIERLAFITDEIWAFCADIPERFVATREGYSFGSKGRATFSLGELGGCVDLTLFRRRPENLVKYFILPPNVAKKYCLGSGGIKKDSGYLLKVYNKFDMEFPDDNQADAFMLAKTLHGFLKTSCVQAPGHEEFIANMTLAEREAMLAVALSTKGSGVTKATLKKMERTEFAKFSAQTLQNYIMFEAPK